MPRRETGSRRQPKGTAYRLVVANACRLQIVDVWFIGTRLQWGAIDVHPIEPS